MWHLHDLTVPFPHSDALGGATRVHSQHLIEHDHSFAEPGHTHNIECSKGYVEEKKEI